MIRKNVSQFDRWEVYGQTDNQLVVAEPEYGFYLLQNDQVSPFLGPNGVYTFSLVLKLSDIYGSIFKINKNLPITEGTFIQLTIAPLDDWLYKSGNGGNNNYDTADLMYVHPPISLFSAVTVNNVLMSPAYTGTPLTFTTCKLRFSQIADDVLNGMAFEKVAMEKLVIPYEYITPMTYSKTGQNQTITHRINAAMGAKLRKTYHSVGNPPAMSSASREVRAATVRTSTKGAYQTGNNQFNSDLSSVQYQLDGRSLITYNILSMDYTVTDYGYPNDVSSYSQTYNADDGANVGKGGFSTRTVANNFYLCYSFEDSDPQKNGDNYNAGIDVRVSDRVYNILVGLTQNLSAGSTLNHYVFTVCTKYLVIDGKSMSSVSSLSSLNL